MSLVLSLYYPWIIFVNNQHSNFIIYSLYQQLLSNIYLWILNAIYHYSRFPLFFAVVLLWNKAMCVKCWNKACDLHCFPQSQKTATIRSIFGSWIALKPVTWLSHSNNDTILQYTSYFVTIRESLRDYYPLRLFYLFWYRPLLTGGCFLSSSPLFV